jgi:hypothetical protein
MTYAQAIAILKAHNEWRRDNEGKHTMPDPKLIGEAIDVLVKHYEDHLVAI